jgi:phosphoribosylaminoimidazole carboxylase (NCAIR synthetase)
MLVLFRDRSPIYRQCLHNFIKVGRDYGYQVIALAPENTKFSPGEVDYYYFCNDYDNKLTVRAQVKDLCRAHDIQRIMVSFEGDVYTGSLCREDNGIEGLQPEHGIFFRDKNAMNARAQELGILVPEWCLPHTFETLKRFTERVGFPIILKPYDGMACKDTYRVNSPEALLNIWTLIRNERHNYRAEAFVRGRQFHLDSLVQNGRVVFELLSEYTYKLLDGVLEGFRYNELVASISRPVDLCDSHQQMLTYNQQLLSGFGLRCGVAHSEFYLTEDGSVYFGEVGARVGGVYIVPMVEQAGGLHLAREWARMELDSNYYPPPRNCRYVGGVKITSSKRGRITALSRAEELMSIDSVLEAQMWKAPGDLIAEPVNSADVLGYYLCAGTSFDDVYKNLRDVYGHFQLQTEEVGQHRKNYVP